MARRLPHVNVPIVHRRFGEVAGLGLIGGTVVANSRVAFGLVAILGTMIIVTGAGSRGNVATLTFAGAAIVWIPFPLGISNEIRVLGATAYISDLFMPLAAVVYWRHRPATGPTVFVPLVVFVAIMLAAAVHGLALRAPPAFWVKDLRGPAYIACTYIIGLGCGSIERQRAVQRIVAAVLGYGAAAILFSAVTGLRMSGRTEGVSLFVKGARSQDFGATRFLLPPTHLALAVLCALLAYLLVVPRRPNYRLKLFLAAPAIIVFLSFSRNSILALGAAVTVAMVAGRALSAAHRLAVGVVWTGLFCAIAVGVAGRFPTGPGITWASKQVAAYGGRVFGGLTAENYGNDTSKSLRGIENHHARRAFLQAPILGGGLGTAYRPPIGSSDFGRVAGRYYVHNGYYWLLAKSGLAGLLAFSGLVVVPAIRGLLRRTTPPKGFPIDAGLAAALIGLLAVNFVAPVSTDVTGASVLGLAAGLLRRRTLPDSVPDAPEPQLGASVPDSLRKGICDSCT